MHALGLEFGSAARLSKRPGSVWNCLWGNALKRSPGIIRKSRVSYPGPGFLSSATWPLLPKKHYNGLNQTKRTRSDFYRTQKIGHTLHFGVSFGSHCSQSKRCSIIFITVEMVRAIRFFYRRQMVG